SRDILQAAIAGKQIENGNVRSFVASGAPEEIRTPDPQIRSLVLYPAELRARRVVAIGSAAQWQEGAMARRGLPAARLCRAAPATPAEWFSNHARGRRDGRQARR